MILDKARLEKAFKFNVTHMWKWRTSFLKYTLCSHERLYPMTTKTKEKQHAVKEMLEMLSQWGLLTEKNSPTVLKLI